MSARLERELEIRLSISLEGARAADRAVVLGDSLIIAVALRTIAIARVSNCYIGLSRKCSSIVTPIHCMIVVDC